jgi:hypothetical protein
MTAFRKCPFRGVSFFESKSEAQQCADRLALLKLLIELGVEVRK